jgi:dienelactone hydrolase
MSNLRRIAWILFVSTAAPLALRAQPYGPPDRSEPGDEMIQAYLSREAEKVSAGWAEDVKSLAEWEQKRLQYVEEYFYMLGLSPRPERTELKAKITGSIVGEGYIVDMLHYQSRPGLYVTGNLYRPAGDLRSESAARSGDRAPTRLPAVFYVCGHSGRGRDGNKVAYQSHGIWFARHGYVCLIVDSLQLGEIAAFHHGTYNLGRWWWHSRGYTPAGVEAWNGVRGIDYLCSRADVDPERIAVTGISGGGAATFWIAAADERVKVAVPVSGMADLESYVSNRVINGHCDCMFLYNTFRWPWTRIAGLVTPRAMLFVNSDNDRIFPMDANERIENRLERLYSLFGAGDRVDAVVSVGGHAYRKDIRQAAYRFLNANLKGDARPIDDSEIDIVSEGREPGPYPIAPERLRVFPHDRNIPRDQLNTTIDEHFVPLAKAELPKGTAGQASGGTQQNEFESWRKSTVSELKRVSFSYFPEEIPAAKHIARSYDGVSRMSSEEGIEFGLVRAREAGLGGQQSGVVLLAVLNDDEAGKTPGWLAEVATNNEAIVLCHPRGIGATKWTRKNGPNYVERSHALLGRTVDAGRVWDVIAAAKFLGEQGGGKNKVHVTGKGAAGIIAAYAAALDDSIAAVTVVQPVATHMDSSAPQFLNVLRVCDVPVALGLIAPRPLTVIGGPADAASAVKSIYRAAGVEERCAMK